MKNKDRKKCGTCHREFMPGKEGRFDYDSPWAVYGTCDKCSEKARKAALIADRAAGFSV